jgi:hypothetical protein
VSPILDHQIRMYFLLSHRRRALSLFRSDFRCRNPYALSARFSLPPIAFDFSRSVRRRRFGLCYHCLCLPLASNFSAAAFVWFLPRWISTSGPRTWLPQWIFISRSCFVMLVSVPLADQLRSHSFCFSARGCASVKFFCVGQARLGGVSLCRFCSPRCLGAGFVVFSWGKISAPVSAQAAAAGRGS